MVPLDKTYSSCFQCHQDTARLPGVPEYNESRALVEDLGLHTVATRSRASRTTARWAPT